MDDPKNVVPLFVVGVDIRPWEWGGVVEMDGWHPPPGSCDHLWSFRGPPPSPPRSFVIIWKTPSLPIGRSRDIWTAPNFQLYQIKPNKMKLINMYQITHYNRMGLRNIRSQKYRVSEISGIRNIRYLVSSIHCEYQISSKVYYYYLLLFIYCWQSHDMSSTFDH